MKRRTTRRPTPRRANPPRSAGRSMSWVFVLDHDGGLHPVSRHRALDQAVAAARRLRDRGVDARIQPEALHHSGGQSTLRGIPLIDTGTEEWTPSPYVGETHREAGPSAKALQSGKVGRSDRSKVAYRLTLCRKRKPSAKGTHRANPQGFFKITAKQFDGYNRARHGSLSQSMSLFDDDFNMKHFGITRAQFFALGQIDARVAGMSGRFTLRGANRWLEEAHPRDVGFVREAFPAAGTHRCNPSASTVKAKVVASKTMGKVYRRRFLLVQLGPGRLVWVEASPSSTIGPIVNRASADAIGVDTDDRGYPLSEEDRRAIVAAFNAYVARRGTAW